MVSITSYYGNSASAENNAKVVTVAGTDFYFSYETLVAIRDDQGLAVIENLWGPTTGKHLNAIDGCDKQAKAERLSEAEFKERVEESQLSQAAKDMFVF
jgi:hypothetical protein